MDLDLNLKLELDNFRSCWSPLEPPASSPSCATTPPSSWRIISTQKWEDGWKKKKEDWAGLGVNIMDQKQASVLFKFLTTHKLPRFSNFPSYSALKILHFLPNIYSWKVGILALAPQWRGQQEDQVMMMIMMIMMMMIMMMMIMIMAQWWGQQEDVPERGQQGGQRGRHRVRRGGHLHAVWTQGVGARGWDNKFCTPVHYTCTVQYTCTSQVSQPSDPGCESTRMRQPVVYSCTVQ